MKNAHIEFSVEILKRISEISRQILFNILIDFKEKSQRISIENDLLFLRRENPIIQRQVSVREYYRIYAVKFFRSSYRISEPRGQVMTSRNNDFWIIPSRIDPELKNSKIMTLLLIFGPWNSLEGYILEFRDQDF